MGAGARSSQKLEVTFEDYQRRSYPRAGEWEAISGIEAELFLG